MSEDLKVGNVVFASRSEFRSYSSVQKALNKHRQLGRDYTELDNSIKKSCEKSPALSTWRKIDMLDIFEGAKLPDLPGIYGFFNLRKNVEPKHRIIYIGKSLKSLKTRTTKNHNKFVKSLRFGATHACYITMSKPLDRVAINTINYTEIFLIQKWSPYLNLQENPFNYEVEPLDFNDNLVAQRDSLY